MADLCYPTDMKKTLDQLLEDMPYRMCQESTEEAFQMLLRYTKELEKENADLKEEIEFNNGPLRDFC